MNAPDDTMLIKLFTARSRWYTTVGLEMLRGLLLLFLPYAALGLMGIEQTATAAALFRLYGSLLIFRGILEQYLRIRQDVFWMRAFLVASLPFNLFSGLVFAQASLEGLMSGWAGWTLAVLCVTEFVEFCIALYRSGGVRALVPVPAAPVKSVR